MRRIAIVVLGGALAATALPAGAEDPPAMQWSSPNALGPTDVTSIAAREGLVVAGGRPVIKDASRVIPGPRATGIFRSVDEGRSWSLGEEVVTGEDGSTERRPITATPSLVALPSQGARAYALFGTEVWRSDDAAAIWERAGSVPGAASSLDVLSDGRVVAGMAAGGLRTSADGGQTWSAFGSGLPANRVNDLHELTASILLVATDGGLFRSSDGGASFTRAAAGILAPTAPALGISGDAEAGPFLAMQGAGVSSTSVYWSPDLGVTWAVRMSPYTHTAGSSNLPRVNPGAFELAAIELNGQRVDAIYAGTPSGLYVSLLATVGTGGGVSVPGVTWVLMQPEPGRRSIADLAAANREGLGSRQDVVYAAVYRASLYRTGLGQRGFAAPGWYDELDGGRVCGDLHAAGDGTLLAACGRHVFRSEDGGATFSAVSEGLPYYSPVVAGFDPIERSADDSLWTSGFADGLYHSAPGGSSWQKVAYPGASIGTMSAHPTRPATLFATGTGTNGGGGILWHTEDAGRTWATHPETGDLIVRISHDPFGPERVLVTNSDGGVFLTGNGGDTWTKVEGLPSDVGWAQFSPARSGLVWASTLSGANSVLYRSDDGGATWKTVGQRPSGSVLPTPWDVDTLYVFDTSRGIWVSRDGGLTYEDLGFQGLPTGFGTVRSNPVVDPARPGRLYVTAGWIAGDTAPQSEWVFSAEDPVLGAA